MHIGNGLLFFREVRECGIAILLQIDEIFMCERQKSRKPPLPRFLILKLRKLQVFALTQPMWYDVSKFTPTHMLDLFSFIPYEVPISESRLCHLESAAFNRPESRDYDIARIDRTTQIREKGRKMDADLRTAAQAEEQLIQSGNTRRALARSRAKLDGPGSKAAQELNKKIEEEEKVVEEMRKTLNEVPCPAGLSGRAEVIERAIAETRMRQMNDIQVPELLYDPFGYAATWIELGAQLQNRLQARDLSKIQRAQLEIDLGELTSLNSFPLSIRWQRFNAIEKRSRERENRLR